RAPLCLSVGRAICECGATDPAHALFDLRCSQKRRSSAQQMLPKMKAGNLQPAVRLPGEDEPQHPKEKRCSASEHKYKKRFALQEQAPIEVFVPAGKSRF